ncbi:transposase [Saccharothrix sp. ALI-22-I]|uniref:transposase n=1 Tax=Saccharothrix sp. ALI-22-I TaxID=1933778 RepID=UPI003FD3BF7A
MYVPADQLDDPGRRAALGIGDGIGFRTKPQPAIDILGDMVTGRSMPSWCAGDEVYGRSGELRTFCEDNGIGYVLRVGCAFRAELAAGVRPRADAAVTRFLTAARSWQIRAVAGSKGERRYAWAWVATTDHRHFLLIRKHLGTGELAYHYYYVPPRRPVTLMTLVRVACLRWPVEEDFGFGKDHFGLDHSQVRLYTALLRHIVLTMAAPAVCAVTAGQAKTRAPQPILPTRPDQEPPVDTGLIAPTVAEIKRLFNLVTRKHHPQDHHLKWVMWRRRHQARARWYHYRTRLRRNQPA